MAPGHLGLDPGPQLGVERGRAGQQVHHGHRPPEGRQGVRRLRGPPATGVQLPVDRPDQGEQRPQRLRGVEVVVERLEKGLLLLPYRCGRLPLHRLLPGRVDQPVVEVPQPPHRLARSRQRVVREAELLPIVGGEHQHPHRRGIDPLLGEVPHREDVAEPLRHLGALEEEELAVDPTAREALARRTLRLRDLVLVVGEDEVDPATMDIDGADPEAFADLVEHHCRALQVPAWAAAAEGRIPCRAHGLVFGRRTLPEREIPHVLLGVLVGGHARAGLEIPLVQLGQATVVLEPRDRIVDRAVVTPIRESALQQLLDQGHHRPDKLGGTGVDVGRLDAQVVAVFEERRHERRDMRLQGDARAGRRPDGAVVDIGQVHDVEHPIPARPQVPPEEVGQQEGAEVADVGVVPHRRPAHVERHLGRGQRLQRLDAPGQAVVEANAHGGWGSDS